MEKILLGIQRKLIQLPIICTNVVTFLRYELIESFDASVAA